MFGKKQQQEINKEKIILRL